MESNVELSMWSNVYDVSTLRDQRLKLKSTENCGLSTVSHTAAAHWLVCPQVLSGCVVAALLLVGFPHRAQTKRGLKCCRFSDSLRIVKA